MREHGLMYTCIFGCYYIGSLGFMYITSFKALIPFLQKKKGHLRTEGESSPNSLDSS